MLKTRQAVSPHNDQIYVLVSSETRDDFVGTPLTGTHFDKKLMLTDARLRD